MLHRLLDESYPTEVRRHIGLLTMARTTANGCFRFAPPFLASIAAGNGTDLAGIGVAVAVSELSGLLSPVLGEVVERWSRRRAMTAGLLGVGVSTAAAAASVHPVMFAVAVVVLAQSKVMFDLGLGSWVSDHVPFERRGRVIGIAETSWALGLLLGVSTMGLVTAAAGWRVGYSVGAVGVVALAGLVARALPAEPRMLAHVERAPRVPVRWRSTLPFLLAMFCLMGSSQALFVTFGTWLEDDFGFTAAALSAVAFGMGLGELFSSLTSARVADRRGKERSAALGGAVMVPAALALVWLHPVVWIGLPLLAIAVAGFEFGIVSAIPLGTRLVQGSPARGMALMLGAGTFGRAATSVPATQLYERHGMGAAALLSGCLALATALLFRSLPVGRDSALG